ncbi:hypothetical protein EON76_06795 [bacterium]|nr:MAG: hypothetical protein EON76_06795 [bacterium]
MFSKMKRVSVLVAALCLFSVSLKAFGQADDSNEGELSSASVEEYQTRYRLNDIDTKLVNNTGDGFEPLYGVRNFRAVLSGVVYRGGANNAYNKHGKRDNQNPLPPLGLKNLCEEGFGQAVYLYSKNFSGAAKQTSCSSTRGSNHINYATHSPLNEEGVYEILKKVHSAIQNPQRGPIYLHCWNGWHASGLASAIVLRQFCGMSASTAVAYWNRNTDGHNKEKAFEKIRARIRNYTAKPEFKISEAQRNAICPN